MKRFFAITFIMLSAIYFSCSEKDGNSDDVASLSLDQSNITMNVGSTIDVTATAKTAQGDNDTINAEPDDTEVAGVSLNSMIVTITGLAAGSAVITVTSGSGLSVTCSVTVQAVEFDAGGVDNISITELQNNNAFIAYHSLDDNKGYWIVADSDGELADSPREFADACSQSRGDYNGISAVTLSNGSVLVAYCNNYTGHACVIDPGTGDIITPITYATDNPSYEKYVRASALSNGEALIAVGSEGVYGNALVVDSSLNITHGLSTFNSTEANSISAVTLSNDNVFLAYINAENLSGWFAVLDSSGSLVAGPVVHTMHAPVSAQRLSGDNVLIAYTGTDYGRFVITNSSGIVTTGPVNFNENIPSFICTTKLTDSNIIIAYQDSDLGNNGKYTVVNESGEIVTESSAFARTWTNDIYVSSIGTGKVIIAYADASDDNKGKFIIKDEASL